MARGPRAYADGGVPKGVDIVSDFALIQLSAAKP